MKKRHKINYKIRLLHLVQQLKVGGAEIALFHYIKALGNENYEHFVYCLGADGPVREKIESLRVPIRMGKRRYSIKHPIRFATSLYSLIRDLFDFIRSEQIQVIQSHSGQTNQLCVATGKLSGATALPTVHSTMAFVDQGSRWDLRIYLRKAVDMFIYRRAEKVLAVSKEVKKVVMKTFGLKDSKVLVLKNGIIFDDTLLKPADLAREFPLSKNAFKIIAVGRLVPLKCYNVLVQAVAELVNQGFDNLLVLIVGDGEERLKLEDLSQRLKLESFIKLIGWRHDVMQLMKAADLFVIPSRFEGLSIAMIEAMACGLPVIASDAPGLKGPIKEGENGLRFPVDDYKALAECIRLLISDQQLRIQLSLRARQSFEREYNMRENIKILDTLFRKYATVK